MSRGVDLLAVFRRAEPNAVAHAEERLRARQEDEGIPYTAADIIAWAKDIITMQRDQSNAEWTANTQ